MDTKNAPEPADETPAAQNQNLAMDVVAAPAMPEETEQAAQNDKPKTPKDNGVTVAIIIAVVAVLVLSGLAILAYTSS